MISLLRGILVGNTPPAVVLDCNGVGYEISLPGSSFASLPPLGEQLLLHTTLVVRAEAHSLYGFFEPAERDLFMHLMRINGIGPKSALALLSVMDAAALAQAVADDDARILCRAPGIGRKTAQRVLIELRDSPLLLAGPATSPVLHQAIEALVALGYPAAKARAALGSVDHAGLDVAEIVKAGLAALTSPPKSGG